MEKRSLGLALAAVTSLFACGSSTTTDPAADAGGTASTVDGTGSASGTIGGQTLTVQAAYSDDTDTSKGEFGNVLLTDTPSLCTSAASNTVPKAALTIDLSLYTIDPEAGKIASAAADTGVYHVDVNDPSLQYVDAFFYPAGGLCGGTGSEAKSGSVTLTAVNADGSYSGTYDLTFGDGSHVTGAFASVACDGVAKVLGTPAPTCN